MSIDKDAFTILMLSDNRRRVRIKKEKYGGSKDAKLFGVTPTWKTEQLYAEGDHIILIQEKSNQREVG